MEWEYPGLVLGHGDTEVILSRERTDKDKAADSSAQSKHCFLFTVKTHDFFSSSHMLDSRMCVVDLQSRGRKHFEIWFYRTEATLMK